MKHSMMNIISTAKPRALLAFTPDPGAWPDSPSMTPRALNGLGSLE
jgi:hypothetical protein